VSEFVVKRACVFQSTAGVRHTRWTSISERDETCIRVLKTEHTTVRGEGAGERIDISSPEQRVNRVFVYTSLDR
jgi:hypothetical protein